MNADNHLLVRVQDQAYGMYVNADGDIILKRGDSKFRRNTCHFSVNGVVKNHVYGTFDGQIAIIARPQDMPIPSGVTQVDVWLHYDSNDELNVGKATVAAPIGTELPSGLSARFFDGTKEHARNDCIHEILLESNIDVKKIGMWGWEGVSIDEQFQWSDEYINQYYSDVGKNIQRCAHSNSIEGNLEFSINACEGSLNKAKTSLDESCTDPLLNHINQVKDAVRTFQNNSHESVNETASKYVNSIIERMYEVENERDNLISKFEKPYSIVDSDTMEDCSNKLTYEEVMQLVEDGGINKYAYIKDIRCGIDMATNHFPQQKWPQSTNVSIPAKPLEGIIYDGANQDSYLRTRRTFEEICRDDLIKIASSTTISKTGDISRPGIFNLASADLSPPPLPARNIAVENVDEDSSKSKLRFR